MKTLNALTCTLAALTFSAIAHAAPVQYQITAAYNGEWIWNGTQSVPTSNFLFTSGTTISATFFYDATTAATSTNNPGQYDLAPYGLNSYYTGSITSFAGSVSGHTFSAATGDTLVGDSNTSSTTGRDGVFHEAGRATNASSPAYTSLQGFSLGDYTLVSMVAYAVGPNTFLSNQSLPSTLTNAIGGNTGLNLSFQDSTGTYRTATFWNGTVTAVPLPTSALLFLSGLVGLGANAARKLKR